MFSMFQKTKWFTLIEIVLVLAIVGILFSVAFNFSWDQIWLVQNKQTKSEFVDTYNRFYQNNLKSKRYAWSIYTWMQIILKWWTGEWFVQYSPISKTILNNGLNKNSQNDLQNNSSKDLKLNKNLFEIKNKIKNWQIELFSWNSELKLEFKPLFPQCQIFFLKNKTSWAKNFEKSEDPVFFAVKYPNKKYCFSLQTPLCQIQETSCEWLWSK